jgi:hypothetical protein
MIAIPEIRRGNYIKYLRFCYLLQQTSIHELATKKKRKASVIAYCIFIVNYDVKILIWF